MDERPYLVCDLCGEIMILDDVFAYADERMLVCRGCDTAEFWKVDAGQRDSRSGG
ncbi:MAG: hypothetical protein QOE35_1125 [Actinomycetota bacterium]|jgi:formylmethanofuran dehydrogenase subunit E